MKTIKAIATQYNGRAFRSRAEARWAVFFDALGWQYDHEPEGYDLGGGIWYLPDFWISTIGFWFEVKGQEPTPDEIEKCNRLTSGTEKPSLIAIGPPEPKMQLIPIWSELDDQETMGGKCFFAEDRRNEDEFWLMGEYWGRSIGPVFGPDHGRYPVVHNKVELAYNLARSARFDT